MWLKKTTAKTLIGILIFQISVSVLAQNGVPSSLEAKVKTGSDATATSMAVGVLGFLEWKAQRVHEAQQKVEKMNKSQNQAQVWQEGKTTSDAQTTAADLNTGVADEQKLNFNVDVALQLNIQDYFSMYLKNLAPEEFKEATKKLNTDEVAELLLAYKNFQDKDKKLPLKFSTIPLNNAKSKKTKI